jgi:hypothetical protein
MQPAKAYAKGVLDACVKKGLAYWVKACFFITVGVLSSGALDREPFWRDMEYKSYLAIQDLRGGQRRLPGTVLVTIGDQEYYGPELAGRRPLRRDYVGKLIEAAAAARPDLIAVDIDLRSPVPDGAVSDYANYQAEDEEFLRKLCAVSKDTPIVLSKAVSQVKGKLLEDRNIYDGNNTCHVPGTRIPSGT